MDNSTNVNKISSVRINEMDLIKVVAILGMIIVHTYMHIFETHQDVEPLYTFICFIGGPMAAPVFMFALGVGIVYTKHNRPMDYFVRGIVLVMMGLTLNIVRLIIPVNLAFDNIPPVVSLALECSNDILQFAGLSFMVVAFLKCLHANRWHILFVSIIMWMIPQCLGDSSINPGVDVFLSFIINTKSPLSFFPLLNWFISIAIGILIGCYIKELGADRGKLYKYIFIVGVALIAFSMILSVMGGHEPLYGILDTSTYMSYCPSVMSISTGTVFVMLSVAYYILKWIKDTTRIDNVTSYLSKNLTRIYIVQWIVIMWTYVFELKEGLLPTDIILLIPYVVVITSISIAAVPLYDKVASCIRCRLNETQYDF